MAERQLVRQPREARLGRRRAFYVGSENLYPARLQELGLVVEDQAAATTMKSDYLDPLWARSRQGALIDPGRNVCGSF